MQNSISKFQTQIPLQKFSISQVKKRSENPERIAKVIARAGLCSRREAEAWIQNGRVKLNGKVITTPANLVTPKDKILVDDNLIPNKEPTRLWIFHKPRGVITSNKDPEGRPTVFSRLPGKLPRVVSIGRLDFNTEGLLLFTNDGGLARIFELPATGWLRQYRVRSYGRIQQEQLDSLKEGVSIDGMFYGSIDATLDRTTKDNCWLTVGLREGKNREVKNVLEHLGLKVNRLIRTSFGPYHLNDLPSGQTIEVKQSDIIDHLSESQIAEAGLVFHSKLLNQAKPKKDFTPRSAKSDSPHDERGRNKRTKSTKKAKSHIKIPNKSHKNDSKGNLSKPRFVGHSSHNKQKQIQRKGSVIKSNTNKRRVR